ncbi:MAG TPA: DUF3788 family protein [Terracidiphilus sp.]|nr:DUF3788 family protein [Terracidiphilus sp.]
MDFPNAFIGKKTQPTSKEVNVKLGPSAPTWNELIAWLKSRGIECKEWKSISPKYGWSLRPTLKARTILHLGPCEGCFRASLILGDRAVAAARASDLPLNLRNEIAEARRYAEGTGVRLVIRESKDLESVRKLVEIKLQN